MHQICHIEIPSNDYEKSKAFYEKVFGWKVEMVPEMNYAMWTAPEPPHGGFNKAKEPCACAEEGVLLYIQVASVDGKVKEIEGAGGKIVKGKTPVADMGWFAVFQDPAGATVCIWEGCEGK